MLTHVIQSTDALCQRILAIRTNTPVIDLAQRHSQTLQASVLKEFRQSQTQLLHLVNRQQQRVEIARQKVKDTSTSSSTWQILLKNYSQEIQKAGEEELSITQSIGKALTEHRTLFAQDAQNIVNEQIRLTAEQKALEDRISAARKKFRSIQKRVKAINGISIVFPIAKLASELTSLIATKKTTERQLADSANESAHLHAQAADTKACESILKTLLPLVSQTNSSIQGIINTISLVNGKVKNEGNFTEEIDEDTALLFLTALETSLKQLKLELE